MISVSIHLGPARTQATHLCTYSWPAVPRVGETVEVRNGTHWQEREVLGVHWMEDGSVELVISDG